MASQTRDPLAMANTCSVGQRTSTEGYPYVWPIYEWLPGNNPDGTIEDLDQAAADLADLVRALRRIKQTAPTNAPLEPVERHSRS